MKSQENKLLNFDFLNSVKGIQYIPMCDLTQMSTLRLRSTGHFAEVSSLTALQEMIQECKKRGVEYSCIGWGANLVLPEICSQLLFKITLPPDEVELSEQRDSYFLNASTSLPSMLFAAKKFGLKGWECLAGIPASVGGALAMNAGTKLGEISSITQEIRLLDQTNHFKNHLVQPGDFSYRKNHFLKEGEVIVGGRFVYFGRDENIGKKIDDYIEYRKQTQPLKTRNCGSVFKNPSPGQSAGSLIEQCGLKGHEKNGLRVSSLHANFIEHVSAQAGKKEFLELIFFIQERVRERFGLDLELEAKVL